MAKDAARKSEAEANYNLAKGIIAETSDGNIIEAMAYYQKAAGSSSSITESASRLSKLTQSLNMQSKVKNEIAERKKWVKVWDDLHRYSQNNCLSIAYNPNSLKVGAIDFKTETAKLDFPIGIKANPVCYELYEKIKSSYEQVQKTSDWGLDTSMYGKDFGGHTVTVEIYDENSALIAKQYCTLKEYEKLYYANIFDGKVIKFNAVNPDRITDKIKIKITSTCPGAVIKVLGK